ncbi:hypothetical protein ACPC54_12285 [Kitasatospora sp. NPDC094028]
MNEQPPRQPAQDAPMVNVAAYWRGDFTLRPDADDTGADVTPDASSLARLGRAGITAHGRDLAALLAPAYDAFRA